jgi:hypothetical protein
MNIIKKIPFHPFIFTLYPVLALTASNLGWISEPHFFLALTGSFLIMFLTFGFTWLLIKNIRKAAAITSLILLLFFTFGHVYGIISKNFNPTVLLTLLWLSIFVGGSWWIISRKNALQQITQSLNLISVLLLLLPLLTFGVSQVQEIADNSKNGTVNVNTYTQNELSPEPSSELPDIYFIILDGYARADTLAEIYDYDNLPLLNDLKERGFYIADESIANYHHTVLSLSTTLNMTYIKDLLTDEGMKSYDYWRIVDHIHHNKVFNLATDAGYQIVVFNSGHAVSDIYQVDHFMRPNPITVTGEVSDSPAGEAYKPDIFDITFLETTALRPLLPVIFRKIPEDLAYENHRQRIQYTFSNLSAFAQADGSYFIFAHVLAPHPPFVFDSNGQSIQNWRPYTVSDGSHWVGGIGTRDEYIAGYRNQVSYINSLLMKAIDDILARSEIPPVIIIQGDHGPGAYFEWQSLKQTNLQERMTILNAMYFPNGDEGLLYPSISPVNTFPVVFNRYLRQDFELSEDKAYFSKWGKPFEFTEVTEQLLEPTAP